MGSLKRGSQRLGQDDAFSQHSKTIREKRLPVADAHELARVVSGRFNCCGLSIGSDRLGFEEATDRVTGQVVFGSDVRALGVLVHESHDDAHGGQAVPTFPPGPISSICPTAVTWDRQRSTAPR